MAITPLSPFIPVGINNDITGTTKFSEYKGKISSALTQFGSGVNDSVQQLYTDTANYG